MRKNPAFNRLILSIVTTSLVFFQSAMAHGDEEHTPLEKSMQESSRALKSFRKMDKSDWAGDAKAVRAAAEGCCKGMAYIPVLIADMRDGKEKTKAVADYKHLMNLSYAALCEFELAYLEENQTKVDTALEKIRAGKKKGSQEVFR